MNISQSSAVSSVVNSQQFDQVSALVLKKALDSQAQTAAQLIQALPETPKPSPSGSLGNNIDVKA